MKKQNGITLIALVISIIVMLILAGVSINAVIGDNGVIGKAQDTLFLNSCAYLEEYFNQLYATCTMENVVVGDTPLHTLMKNGYQNYFFSTSEGACLKKVVVNEETGTNQTIVLYLVKKEQLPEEIRTQLTGAENLESRDYRKLRGCYGITSDLKAYYCENGLDTIMGLTKDDLNADSPDIVFAEEDSILAEVVNGGTAPVTNQGLKTIKRLTIDSVEKLSLLQDFSKFLNLTEVYFSGIEIPNLVGIEGAAYSINYIKFTNCNVQDYSALNSLTNLKQLYLVTPTGMNDEIIRLGSTDKGIASGEFDKLEYFGIVGSDLYLNGSDKNSYSSARYDIKDISSLVNFSDVTKKAIKYMNLQNLQLTSIASLAEFTNVYYLNVDYNAITTFEGMQNMSALKYLLAKSQYSNATATYNLGANEGDTLSSTDALKYIYKNNNANTILYYVDLRYNSKLKYVDSLGECTAIRYLYMDSCTSIKNASTIKTILGNCGANYSIPGAYGLEIIADNTKVLSLNGKTLTIEEIEQLKNRTTLTHLDLNGISITDSSGVKLTSTTTPTFNEILNGVLETCINLQYLKLSSLTYLTTIDFVSTGKCTKLIDLDLRNSGVTDLTNLNTYATSLKNLFISNKNIDITTIQSTINRCTGTTSYWNGTANGCCMITWDLISQLSNCNQLTKFKSYFDGGIATATDGKILDLTNTSIESFNITYYKCIVKYPPTIKSIYNDYCAVPNFSVGTDKLTTLTLKWNRTLSTEAQWEESMKSIANIVNLKSLEISNTKNFKLDYLKYLSNLQYLELFSYYQSGENGVYGKNITNLDGIGNLKQIKTLKIDYFLDITDISDVANCTNLTNLTIRKLPKLMKIDAIKNLTNLTDLVMDGNKISNINSLGNLVNLKNLNLDNNSIADIYPLMNCTKLETLYIQNNTLNDFGYHTNSSGSTIGYEVMDVFYDLNHAKQGALKNLYISGNIFDDTEILLDLTWDGKSGF